MKFHTDANIAETFSVLIITYPKTTTAPGITPTIISPIIITVEIVDIYFRNYPTNVIDAEFSFVQTADYQKIMYVPGSVMHLQQNLLARKNPGLLIGKKLRKP